MNGTVHWVKIRDEFLKYFTIERDKVSNFKVRSAILRQI